MRYYQIRETDIANGQGIGVALFVQGCHFNCPGCFNPETHDFSGGKEWTKEVEEEFLKLIDRPYIKRVSILGGEPLAEENVVVVRRIIEQIKLIHPNKKIWLYTGFTWENSILLPEKVVCPDNYDHFLRHLTAKLCDVLVDGPFQEDKKDPKLSFRGSSNQRLIDVQKSFQQGEIILWTP